MAANSHHEPTPHPTQPSQKPAKRPTKYTKALGDRICGLLIDGVSTRSICKMEGFPNPRYLFKWLEENEAFNKRYRDAKRIQLELLGDEMQELADKERIGNRLKQKQGARPEAISGDNVERSKLQIHTRMWLLARLMPTKYGDRPEPAKDKNNQLESFFQALMAGPAVKKSNGEEGSGGAKEQ